jgi:hypothetical protein
VSDMPISLGERRALRDDDCTKWTPKELLSAMLRDIDTLKPEGIVVCYFRRDDAGTITGMRRSNTTVMEAVAMIEMAKYDLLHVE